MIAEVSGGTLGAIIAIATVVGGIVSATLASWIGGRNTTEITTLQVGQESLKDSLEERRLQGTELRADLADARREIARLSQLLVDSEARCAVELAEMRAEIGRLRERPR